MSQAGPMRHLSDAELAALLEGEEGAPAAGRSAHVAECAACTARLEDARDSWSALQGRLPDADPTPEQWARLPGTPPAARRPVHARAGYHLRRAAAVGGLLLLVGAAVTPIRAAVLEWVQRTWAAATTREMPAPPPRPDDRVASPTSSPSSPGTEYRIDAPGGDARVAFRARPAAGTITITITIPSPAGGHLTLQSSGGQGDPVLALPDGFIIQNNPSSRGDYRLYVPPEVERLWLTTPEGRMRVTRDRLRDGPVIVPLAGAAAPNP